MSATKLSALLDDDAIEIAANEKGYQIAPEAVTLLDTIVSDALENAIKIAQSRGHDTITAYHVEYGRSM